MTNSAVALSGAGAPFPGGALDPSASPPPELHAAHAWAAAARTPASRNRAAARRLAHALRGPPARFVSIPDQATWARNRSNPAKAPCARDDEEDEGEPDLPDDADASGLYNGTILLGGVTRNMTVAVAPNGEFNGLIAATAGSPNQRLLLGAGAANGNAFTATGTAFASIGGEFPAGGIVANISITSGVITEHVQLTGSYATGGDSGTFTLSYNTGLTNRGASLARIAGTYSTPPGPVTATVSVQTPERSRSRTPPAATAPATSPSRTRV